MSAVRDRPSLTERSLFAFTWHLSVWVGWSVVTFAVYRLAVTPGAQLQMMAPTFLILMAMVLLGELRPVVASVSYEAGGFPLSWTFVFAALYLWGLVPAMILQTIAVIVQQLLLRREPWRLAFNVGQYSCSLFAAWIVLGATNGSAVLGPAHVTFDINDLVGITLATLTFHLVNLALVSGTGDSDKQSWWDSFKDDFWYYTFSMFAVLAVAPFVVVMAGQAWQYIALLLLPLFGIYKTATLARTQERQALHDALTDLPNRTLFGQRLEAALTLAERDQSSVAVLLLDLDRFKEVNDTLGHPAGDQLLEVVARRLLSAVRPDDVVARLGGDEFAVLLPDIRAVPDAIDVAGRIRSALAEPFRLEGVLMEVDVSIGIAFSPEHGSQVDLLLRRADVAMYVAKGERTGIEIYDLTRDPNSTERLGAVAALREALDAEHLELFFQPKVSLVDGRIVGAEALIRWRDPVRGLILPDEFVPLAETTGLIHRLTTFVISAALAQVADWWARGLRVPVAVNVSMRDLQTEGLAELIAHELDRRGLPPEALVLEVTESIIVQDPGQAVETLRELAELGVSSSLDDFGTGYSSLLLLEQLPVSELKIDRSFVRRLDEVGGDASMVASIVGFAKGLGLTVVAEGVETALALRTLRELGCDVAQGFRVARPMPALDATRWLMDRIVTSSTAAAATTAAPAGGSGATPVNGHAPHAVSAARG